MMSYPQGHLILEEGQHAGDAKLYEVKSGRIRIESGGVVLAILEAGEI